MNRFILSLLCVLTAFALMSCSHSHTLSNELLIVREPTCSLEGEGHLICTECGEVAHTVSLPTTDRHQVIQIDAAEPTCSQSGHSSGTKCSDCGVILSGLVEIPTLEHTYSEGACLVCNTEHPSVSVYNGKVISILGDSISTYKGYIPTADGFNLEHYARYPQDNLFTGVEHTWWMQVITALDAKLGINESWRSTEVGNIYDVEVNSGYEGTKACMASTTRIQNLGSNGTPDVILFYGGTNDITQNRAVGTFDTSTAPTDVDLTSVKWDTVAEAYVAAIMRMQYYYPDAQIIAMLPTYTSGNNHGKIEKYNSVFAAICEHYGVTYIDLRECGITTSNLPDGTHPDKEGMDFISEAVLNVLLENVESEVGENVVHSVTHNLRNATSSKSYYKGVSHGRAFITEISGLVGGSVEVSVTMDGVDITESCYADGVINIPKVTGDLIIKVEGACDGITSDTNLWTLYTPEKGYYDSTKSWGYNGDVHSVTVSVEGGYKINATSFGATAMSDGTVKYGIRISYIYKDGSMIQMSPSEVYAEYKSNGNYLIVPEGVAYMNIPMWETSDANAIYIVNIGGEVLLKGLCCLPAEMTSDTNLWTECTPEKGYYGTNGAWDTSNGNVHSVTIPVSGGYRIDATSFKSKNDNGSSVTSGIRITYFKEDGAILKSLSPAEVYAEYSVSGFVTVPEGAAYVNIPMWTSGSNNEIYILNFGE